MAIEQVKTLAYASDVGRGAGRTPIGIILFACSHLLLGGVMLLGGIPLTAHGWRGGRLNVDLIVGLLMICTAAPMISGGAAMFLKGQLAWRASLISFAALAALEGGFAGFVLGCAAMIAREGGTATRAAALGLILCALLWLCIVVLRYLTLPKARQTFHLTPGESTDGVRFLPLIMGGVAFVLIVVGVVLGMILPT